MAQLCYSGLMLVISCPDWIAADTVFCSSNRAEIMCVFMCMSAGVSACESFCDCVSKCVLWGKMQDDSKGEERGNRCGGILKASGNTHTHTFPISSGLLCSCDRLDTYHIFVSVCEYVFFLCTFVALFLPMTISVYV